MVACTAGPATFFCRPFAGSTSQQFFAAATHLHFAIHLQSIPAPLPLKMLSRSMKPASTAFVRLLHTLPKLPYALEAGVAPLISARTLDFHYNKHHQAYVTNTNNFIKGTKFETMSLEDTIRAVANDASKVGLFNNAAQVWHCHLLRSRPVFHVVIVLFCSQVFNHTFYFESLRPNGSSLPDNLKARLAKDFGSTDEFKSKFSTSATTLFGSGWTWLTMQRDGKLKISNTSCVSFLISGSFTGSTFHNCCFAVCQKCCQSAACRRDSVAVLRCLGGASSICWCGRIRAFIFHSSLFFLSQHAYYLDYQNVRAEYVKKFWQAVDWERVANRLSQAKF